MIKYAIVIDEKTGMCNVGTGTNSEYYKSIGMKEMDVEQAYNGSWFISGYAPVEPVEEKNEAIRQQRQFRFQQEADPLRLDWDESAARGEAQAEEKKLIWLAKKDEIRQALPYISEAGDGEA